MNKSGVSAIAMSEPQLKGIAELWIENNSELVWVWDVFRPGPVFAFKESTYKYCQNYLSNCQVSNFDFL